jgi:hypothetical protein
MANPLAEASATVPPTQLQSGHQRPRSCAAVLSRTDAISSWNGRTANIVQSDTANQIPNPKVTGSQRIQPARITPKTHAGTLSGKRQSTLTNCS